MNQYEPKLLQFNLSDMGCLLALVTTFVLLGSVGLSWVVNSFLILVGVLLIAPVIGWFGFRWWLKRNLVEDNCPVCGFEFTGFNRIECRCPSCGEPLKVEQGHFNRLTPPGTIDVDAVEVLSQRLEE
ncbi:MAG TPA: hypothetical protein V6D11_19425 [Waterburya sp.]